MKTHLFRLFVFAGSALALNLSPALINQDTLIPSAHAQSKNKKKAKSFRGPSSRGRSTIKTNRPKSSSRSKSHSRKSKALSRSLSRSVFSGNLGSRSYGNNRSYRSNRSYGNTGSYGNDRLFGSSRSYGGSLRSRSSSPFSSRRNRGRSYGRNNSLGFIIGLGALSIGNSNRYSDRRRYSSQPFGWRRHGWRSSSWRAPYYEPPHYREPHRLWGESYYHERWGWYYTDVVNQSTLVFVDREPGNCDYVEYQDDILLECDKVLYRPSTYKGQQVFEIVDDY